MKRVSGLLKVGRSTIYYKGESRENMRLMEQIEGIHSRDPATGYRRMRAIPVLKFSIFFGVLN